MVRHFPVLHFPDPAIPCEVVRHFPVLHFQVVHFQSPLPSTYSAADRGTEYCDERVCLSVFVRDHIFGTARPIFTKLLPWLGPPLAA